MDADKIHDLAIAYATVKLQECEIYKREAPLCGNTDMTEDEIRYLKAAYDFAIQKLS